MKRERNPTGTGSQRRVLGAGGPDHLAPVAAIVEAAVGGDEVGCHALACAIVVVLACCWPRRFLSSGGNQCSLYDMTVMPKVARPRHGMRVLVTNFSSVDLSPATKSLVASRARRDVDVE